MKTTIIYRQIVEMLSQAAGCSVDDAEKFIQALCSTIESRLRAHGTIAINNFGRFVRTTSPDQTPVIEFIPDNELAEKVNAPFAFFEAVELNDGVTDDMLFASDEKPSATETDEEEPATVADGQPEAGIPPVPVPIPCHDEEKNIDREKDKTEEKVTEEKMTEEKKKEVKSTPSVDNEPCTSVTIPDISTDNDRQLNPVMTFIAGIAIGLIIGAMCGYFIYPRLNKISAESVDTMSEQYDSEESAPTRLPANDSDTISLETKDNDIATVNKIVTDTVTRSRFLTTMSRKYYGGRFEFWVYIYEENKDKLGNPDRIPPGTVVVIPDRSKYDINPSDEASIERALAKGRDIYNTYQK